MAPTSSIADGPEKANSDVVTVSELTHKLFADAKAIGIKRGEIDEEVESLDACRRHSAFARDAKWDALSPLENTQPRRQTAFRNGPATAIRALRAVQDKKAFAASLLAAMIGQRGFPSTRGIAQSQIRATARSFRQSRAVRFRLSVEPSFQNITIPTSSTKDQRNVDLVRTFHRRGRKSMCAKAVTHRASSNLQRQRISPDAGAAKQGQVNCLGPRSFSTTMGPRMEFVPRAG